MSHPSVFVGRRGSAAADEHQTSAAMAHVTPSGSSSPGPHHPPHSLGVQSAGAQVKKKSGFQITSVLPAQISASGNNSMADDTESYDDMDESHTEDLSSSDILDVSVSRATDTGIPERSSSEETLNSLHGGETPGVVSPNEPVMHHAQQGYMVNGVHHHHHAHHHKSAQGRSALTPAAPSGPGMPGKVTSGRSVQAAVAEASRVAVSAPDATGPGQPQSSAASTASRFRVVKLDSNSEPFRKGRWTCTEFYEKDAPPADATAAAAAAAHRTVENIVHSEHETTSGSSSGSTISGGGDVPQTHPQDPAAVSSVTPETVPAVVSSDSVSSGPVRPHQQVQSGYPGSSKPPVSAGPCLKYAQIGTSVQPLQIPPVQSAASPRAAPAAVSQPVSPRLQASISVPPGQQHTGAQLSLSSASGLQQGGRVLPAGVSYSGVTASQLEDAQRLLLQHHPLLSLPRLATGGDAGADAAFAVTTGADEDSSSGASVVAIDNKIEQAMDLVKSHLMYAVREEVEVLKEQIKELIERNSQLEQENTLLKNLASPEQLAQFQAQVQSGSPTAGPPPTLPSNQGPGPIA